MAPIYQDAPEDGVERGIAAFVICASLIRQFEFAQNVWVNDRNFHEFGNERDPIIGNQDGTLELRFPTVRYEKKSQDFPRLQRYEEGLIFSFPDSRLFVISQH